MACIFFCVYSELALGQITVLDDTGRTVTLQQPARRIITLAPHLTELVFEIGAGELIVATVEFSDYPPHATRIARIGNADHLNIESILGVRPDLILAWHSGNNPYQLAVLERLGLPIYRSEPGTLSAVPETLMSLGVLTGRTEEAGTVSTRLREAIDRFSSEYAGRQPVTAFYQVWDQPIYTVNGAHIISDVLRLCGVRNVFAGVSQLAPQINEEAVLAADPQMIIAGQTSKHVFARWRKWPQLTAVAQNNLFQVPPELMQRHSSRLLQGARKVCEDAQMVRKKGGQTH